MAEVSCGPASTAGFYLPLLLGSISEDLLLVLVVIELMQCGQQLFETDGFQGQTTPTARSGLERIYLVYITILSGVETNALRVLKTSISAEF